VTLKASSRAKSRDLPRAISAIALVAPALLLLLLTACASNLPTVDPRLAQPDPLPALTAPDERIVYLALTDRFENGDSGNDEVVDLASPLAYHGGDFAGMARRLNYLAELGVTTLWMSPFVEQIDHPVGEEAPHWGFHGYWAEHFDRVEPRFGSEEELAALLDAAHALGLEVIADIVINHPGYGSHFVNEAGWVRSTEAGSCPDEGATDIDMCLFGLPDFRTEDPAVASALSTWQSAWFARLPLDGLRADTVKHVEDDVWRAFLSLAREAATERGDLWTLGESWGTAPGDETRWLAPDLFDAVFDFEFADLVESFLNGRMRAAAFGHHMNRRNDAAIGRYVHYLNTHDTAGFIDRLDDADAYPAALALLLTSAGVPLLYYGDELGRVGGEWPANRPDMDWTALDDIGATPFRLTQQLIALRRDHPALRRGRLELMHADEDLVVMARESPEERVVIAMNRGEQPVWLDCGACSMLVVHNAEPRASTVTLDEFGFAIYQR